MCVLSLLRQQEATDQWAEKREWAATTTRIVEGFGCRTDRWVHGGVEADGGYKAAPTFFSLLMELCSRSPAENMILVYALLLL